MVMRKRDAIIIVALLGIALLSALIAYQFGLQAARPHSAAAGLDAETKANDKSLNLICDLRVSMPRAELDSPRDNYNQMFIAGIDFASRSGWYQGQFAISETRKGTVTTEGSTLTVRRPAMFPRFGVMIAGEAFSLNRETGEFRQWLTLQDGNTLDLMKGYCGSCAKAPF
jgi:hypothetical protein